MIFRPQPKTRTIPILLAIAMNAAPASAAHDISNICLGMLYNHCVGKLLYNDPDVPSIRFYDTSEVDSQMASLRAQLQTAQSGVATQLTQFNQDAEHRISEAVAKTLIVNDLDNPTEAQQPLIRIIQQIVRQEVQRSLQQTQ